MRLPLLRHVMKLPLLRPVAHRPTALLWAGLAGAAVGDELFRVVLGYVAVRTLGPDAGYLAVAQAVATLAALLLGARLLERLPPLRVMLGADLVRAGALAGLAAVWFVLGDPPAWALFAAIVVLGAGLAAFRPAMQAALPVLAGDRTMLPAANALMDTTERLARLAGPGLLVVAAALLAEVHFVTVNVATFLLSAVAVVLIARRHRVPAAQDGSVSLWAAAVRGVRAVRGHGLLRYMLVAVAPQNGMWIACFYLALPLHLERGFGTGGLAAFGTVMAAYGLGNLAATLVLGNMGMPARPARRVFLGILLFGTATAAMAGAMLLPAGWQVPAIALCAAVAAVGGPMQDIVVATLRQTELPQGDIAAAVRAHMVSVQLGAVVTMLAAPALVAAVGPEWVVLVGAAVFLGIGALGLWRVRG
jgi:MFS transporter, DHA3 family, macrolide efflux protein